MSDIDETALKRSMRLASIDLTKSVTLNSPKRKPRKTNSTTYRDRSGFFDLTNWHHDKGEKFGRLTVNGLVFNRVTYRGANKRRNMAYVPVVCKCGVKFDVRVINLRNGTSRRCRFCASRDAKALLLKTRGLA